MTVGHVITLNLKHLPVGFLSPPPPVVVWLSWPFLLLSSLSSSSSSSFAENDANDGTNSAAFTFSLISFCCKSLALASARSDSSHESGAALVDMSAAVGWCPSRVFWCQMTSEKRVHLTASRRTTDVDEKKTCSKVGK